jgi:hypothetical protein
MTQASAGISVASSTSLPVTSHLPPTDLLGTQQAHYSAHLETPTPPQITLRAPSANARSFFDVRDDTQLLSSRSRRHVTRAIQNGWAGSTVKRYSGSIEQFIRFCDTEGVPSHLRFPADEFVLCAFAASSAGIHARTTPRGRLSALKAWHVAHNMEWKGSARLRYVLNGVHNLAPRGSRRPPRPPITASMISLLVEHLDLNSSLDAAVAACATTAFWGQCRLGELLPTSMSDTLSTPFPLRSSFKRSVRNPLSCIIHLPRTKTHHHGQDIVLVEQANPSNPISLLKRHLRVNNVSNDSFLFSYTSKNGLSPLTKPIFLKRCNEIWHPLGYPRTTGHCFRIGGTTELLIAGIPPDIVKVTGRWSSDSFLRYWRSLDDIAPQYMRHLHSKKRRRKHR